MVSQKEDKMINISLTPLIVWDTVDLIILLTTFLKLNKVKDTPKCKNDELDEYVKMVKDIFYILIPLNVWDIFLTDYSRKLSAHPNVLFAFNSINLIMYLSIGFTLLHAGDQIREKIVGVCKDAEKYSIGIMVAGGLLILKEIVRAGYIIGVITGIIKLQ